MKCVRGAILFLCYFVMLAAPAISFCEDDTDIPDTPQDEPVVEMRPTAIYTTRRIILFPLELPAYAVKFALWPVGQFFNFLEEKHVIQKTLDLLSNKEKTRWVYPIIEGGAGAGFGGGVGVRDTNFLGDGYLFGASYKNHINMNQMANVSFGKPNAFELFGRPFSYSMGVDFASLLSENFFGLGNDTQEGGEGAYSFNRIKVGSTLSYSPVRNFSVTLNAAFDADNAFTKKEGDVPPVQDMFPSSALAGFGRWLNYVELGLRVAHDTRDLLESTQKGGLRAVRYRRSQCVNDSSFSYNSMDLDVRQFIPLFRPRQVLMLRTNWVFQGAMASETIPFWRLAYLDASDFLRGFTAGRFRDRDYLLFNAEYRFPVWKNFDGLLLYDTGRVFHTVSDASFSNIKYSAGGGLNFRIPRLMLFQFVMAYGGEGLNIMFGASKQL